jgi:hypothetical protein
MTATDPPQGSADPDQGVAPRPRPGYTTPSGKISTNQMAALVGGVFRTVVGVLGFFAALLYLPVHQATPILAGVSLLLTVTGTVTVHRAIEGQGGVRLMFRVLLGATLVSLATITVLVVVLGAGAFRPRPPPTADDRPPTVRFEMNP